MFSPKGNLHQADYALKAVNRAKPSIGISTDEGESLFAATIFDVFFTPQTKSTLLMLVSAFLGSVDDLHHIYNHAIKENYRFYSFGDAMLIL